MRALNARLRRPNSAGKVPSGTPPFATMAILSASHATAHPWLHSLPPRVPGKALRATRWWMHWSAGAEWPPAAASALPRPLSCRAWELVAHRALRCLGWPSQQAPLAGALSLELKYLVLEGLQRSQGGSWQSPGKPLPRGAATARAQVRGTRVPLF